MAAEIIQNLRHKNYVPPVSERQLGWLCYAEKLPVDACGTDAMRKGWLSAWRAESFAVTSEFVESQVSA